MKMTAGRDSNGRIRIGYWKNKDEPDLPDPSDFIDKKWDWEEQDKVVKYLTRDQFCSTVYKGWSTCRICGCKNWSADMTDGTYVWPSGFQHYVLGHNVKPTSKFLQHVLEQSRNPPQKPELKNKPAWAFDTQAAPKISKKHKKQHPANFDDYCPVCRGLIGWDKLVELYGDKSFQQVVKEKHRDLECPHCECALQVCAVVFFGLRQAPFE